MYADVLILVFQESFCGFILVEMFFLSYFSWQQHLCTQGTVNMQLF